MQHYFYVASYITGTQYLHVPSEHVFDSYFVIHNIVRRPRTKFTVFFFGYFCCFCINFTQINVENFQK